MKIKTDRVWDIETKMDIGTDCFEIKEHHEGSGPEDHKPYIVIPVEAVDEVVLQLLKFKKRCL